MNKADLTYFDVGLDPTQDPRLKDKRFSPEDLDLMPIRITVAHVMLSAAKHLSSAVQARFFAALRMTAPCGYGYSDRHLVSEEMLTLNLNPDTISEEAYLKARRQYVAGRLNLNEFRQKVLQYQAEYDQQDATIGELVDEMDAQWETTEEPKE